MGQRRNITSPQTWQPHNLDFLGRLHILILWSVILRLACGDCQTTCPLGGGAWKHTIFCANLQSLKHRGCVLDSWPGAPGWPFPWKFPADLVPAVMLASFQVYFAQSCRFPTTSLHPFFPRTPSLFMKEGFPGPLLVPLSHNQHPCLWAIVAHFLNQPTTLLCPLRKVPCVITRTLARGHMGADPRPRAKHNKPQAKTEM